MIRHKLIDISCIFVILSLFLNIPYLTQSLNVAGKCGFPGKPYMSKLDPDNNVYYEGEEVTYVCTEYWFYQQSRKCEGGRWTGREARCGEFSIKYMSLQTFKFKTFFCR